MNLEFTAQKTTMAEYTFYNELGKKVKAKKKSRSAEKNQLSIDLEKLKAGIYFVSIELEGEIITGAVYKKLNEISFTINVSMLLHLLSKL